MKHPVVRKVQEMSGIAIPANWDNWSKAVVAAIMGVVLGAGALALAFAPDVARHERLLTEQHETILALSAAMADMKSDVAVTRAIVERLEKRNP
jgi:hypothetical protein